MRSGHLKLALCLTLLTYPGATAAQRLPERDWVRPTTVLATAPSGTQGAKALVLGGAPDYRWEGLVIGAVALGLVTGAFANGMCGYSDSPHGGCLDETLLGVAVGATAGAVVGGLIGGLIPKTPAATEQEP